MKRTFSLLRMLSVGLLALTSFAVRANNPATDQLVKELQEQIGPHAEIEEGWYLDISADDNDVVFTVLMEISDDEMYSLDTGELTAMAEGFVDELVEDFGSNKKEIEALFKKYGINFVWEFRNRNNGLLRHGMSPAMIFGRK